MAPRTRIALSRVCGDTDHGVKQRSEAWQKCAADFDAACANAAADLCREPLDDMFAFFDRAGDCAVRLAVVGAGFGEYARGLVSADVQRRCAALPGETNVAFVAAAQLKSPDDCIALLDDGDDDGAWSQAARRASADSAAPRRRRVIVCNDVETADEGTLADALECFADADAGLCLVLIVPSDWLLPTSLRGGMATRCALARFALPPANAFMNVIMEALVLDGCVVIDGAVLERLVERLRTTHNVLRLISEAHGILYLHFQGCGSFACTEAKDLVRVADSLRNLDAAQKKRRGRGEAEARSAPCVVFENGVAHDSTEGREDDIFDLQRCLFMRAACRFVVDAATAALGNREDRWVRIARCFNKARPDSEPLEAKVSLAVRAASPSKLAQLSATWRQAAEKHLAPYLQKHVRGALNFIEKKRRLDVSPHLAIHARNLDVCFADLADAAENLARGSLHVEGASKTEVEASVADRCVQLFQALTETARELYASPKNRLAKLFIFDVRRCSRRGGRGSFLEGAPVAVYIPQRIPQRHQSAGCLCRTSTPSTASSATTSGCGPANCWRSRTRATTAAWRSRQRQTTISQIRRGGTLPSRTASTTNSKAAARSACKIRSSRRPFTMPSATSSSKAPSRTRGAAPSAEDTQSAPPRGRNRSEDSDSPRVRIHARPKLLYWHAHAGRFWLAPPSAAVETAVEAPGGAAAGASGEEVLRRFWRAVSTVRSF